MHTPANPAPTIMASKWSPGPASMAFGCRSDMHHPPRVKLQAADMGSDMASTRRSTSVAAPGRATQSARPRPGGPFR